MRVAVKALVGWPLFLFAAQALHLIKHIFVNESRMLANTAAFVRVTIGIRATNHALTLDGD